MYRPLGRVLAVRTLALLPLAALAMSMSARGDDVRPAKSGIDASAADPAVRMQDDAYRAVNGTWLKTATIPADRSGAGTNWRIFDTTQGRLRELIEDAADRGAAATPASAMVGDLFASFMDEARADALGLRPVAADLARIDAMRTPSDVVTTFATLQRMGADAPLVIAIHQDAKDPTMYIADLQQSGIGMPNRDYFIVKDDARFADARAKYRTFLAHLLARAGSKDAGAEAAAVMSLGTSIAEAQWDEVSNRDPVRTYNVKTVAELGREAPHVDWTRYLAASGLAGPGRAADASRIGVAQPSFVTALDRVLITTPIATWKAYCKTRLLATYAQYLDADLVAARFAFVGTALRGATENTPRWKRGVRLVDQQVGEALGQLYVAREFPPERKARIEAMVRHILDAYRDSIASLDWMGPDTKAAAQAKLATFALKIGYPDRWRDYASLVIRRDDLVGNVERASQFEYRRQIAKLGRPIDRGEWGMTPQTVNAYYNAELNEIVFAAGWLQPPYFDADADDAVNYGAIGAIIGHEISHGFDDAGSQYDGDGRLRNWWTDDDRRRFAEKTRALVAQYDAYAPLPGYRVNGALTLGENIADNAGLAVALKGYHRSLAGAPAPVIDGLTGDQRFFIGFAQAWQEKVREPALVVQLKSDPHAPGEFRANGTLVNQPAFQEAFDVRPGDRMYRPPEQRVLIW